MTRRFAENTTVPIAKSRGEIDSLLRKWGVTGIQWSDDFSTALVRLRFVWLHQKVQYRAHIDLKLKTDEQLRREMWGSSTSSKMEKARANNGKAEHRLLLLWLKAMFNAVEGGLIDAERLFLPFLEGTDGRTVADVALPRMHDLLTGSAVKLLEAPQ